MAESPIFGKLANIPLDTVVSGLWPTLSHSILCKSDFFRLNLDLRDSIFLKFHLEWTE